MIGFREEFPLEDWIEELAVLIKHVEGIKKNEAYRRFIDNATELVGYYQIGMTPRQAVDKFWMGEKK